MAVMTIGGKEARHLVGRLSPDLQYMIGPVNSCCKGLYAKVIRCRLWLALLQGPATCMILTLASLQKDRKHSLYFEIAESACVHYFVESRELWGTALAHKTRGVAESESKCNEPCAKESTRTGKIRVERGNFVVRVLIAHLYT
jgi:hypothetical protein